MGPDGLRRRGGRRGGREQRAVMMGVMGETEGGSWTVPESLVGVFHTERGSVAAAFYRCRLPNRDLPGHGGAKKSSALAQRGEGKRRSRYPWKESLSSASSPAHSQTRLMFETHRSWSPPSGDSPGLLTSLACLDSSSSLASRMAHFMLSDTARIAIHHISLECSGTI